MAAKHSWELKYGQATREYTIGSRFPKKPTKQLLTEILRDRMMAARDMKEDEVLKKKVERRPSERSREAWEAGALQVVSASGADRGLCS
jgi:hypothetical protein